MKRSELKQIIREEIRKALKEAYGMESIYYSAPAGGEQVPAEDVHIQHYDNLEKWKITAMQLGAVIQDRGDDWIAVMPNQDKLGTFSKMNYFGTLTI
jgi:hypothetical protein